MALDHQSFLATLTDRCGVYRMIGTGGEILYVGKAKNLKRRIGSYFSRALNLRLQAMTAQIIGIEVTVTHTESEALLLENNLIKSLQPRYNVLLRDDKSYPYIYLSEEDFPRLAFHRGSRSKKGRFFGPYPSASATRETLQLMQKLFPVRQCEDSVFRNRSRPCLQYQIRRCTAPCVGLIDSGSYGDDVRQAVLFLTGKGRELIDEWVRRMDEAAGMLEFERAAKLRDQISSLQRIQERQYISGESGDLDLVACHIDGGAACVQVFFVRAGRNLGNKTLFPKLPDGADAAELMNAFLGQYYSEHTPPGEILVTPMPTDYRFLEEALTTRIGSPVRVRSVVRGERARWMKMTEQNARLALESRLAVRAGLLERLEALREALNIEEVPSRIECFDISHTGGTQTVGSCVVFSSNGAVKSDYRRYNVRDVTPGDDYAALEQVLSRRYERLQKEGGALPDVILIDGGKGQLARAHAVLEELGIPGVLLLGVAKGPDRKPGMERLFLPGSERPLIVPEQSAALHLIQQIRDEAHRFAITGHRGRRSRSGRASTLEAIPGVGPTRRRRLLAEFGGLRGLERAGVEDLCRVKGVSRLLAQQIYDAFHGQSG